MILPVRRTGKEQDGWVVGVTFSSSKAEAAATLCPGYPEQGLVAHGVVEQGTPSSLWWRGVEKSSGTVQERNGRAGVKMFSSGLLAAGGPGLGHWRDHHLRGRGDWAEADG